ncbi:DUF4177 domain-containing protein [Scopulibacillus cellulosilyticus]|uniref:DUF4177 domain-containing protein n=1 Tax=Scopulibacillus cellulosilyticus TaxID=2665665 RepID=A0ABW2Q158_9BACL
MKEHTKDGWRLHTFAPLSSGIAGGFGQTIAVEIIFEKEVQ